MTTLNKEHRYQISASKDGSLGKRIESPIFEGQYAEQQAIRWANEHCAKHRCVNLLREDEHPINAGKFFLHRFLKSH